ncbi:LOW QUALITY PROTEIN: hypothetical protein TMLG_01036, partial [Mycobacterium tuberculosis SUMu012]
GCYSAKMGCPGR